MQMTLGEYDEGYGAQLLCPACGCNNIHHDKVEIFENMEGAPTRLHVTVQSELVEMDTSLKGNPSRDRNGLIIYFWCEDCPKKSILSLAQHKGLTFIDVDILKHQSTPR